MPFNQKPDFSIKSFFMKTENATKNLQKIQLLSLKSEHLATKTQVFHKKLSVSELTSTLRTPQNRLKKSSTTTSKAASSVSRCTMQSEAQQEESFKKASSDLFKSIFLESSSSEDKHSKQVPDSDRSDR